MENESALLCTHTVNALRHFYLYLIASRGKNIMEAVIRDTRLLCLKQLFFFCCMQTRKASRTSGISSQTDISDIVINNIILVSKRYQ